MQHKVLVNDIEWDTDSDYWEDDPPATAELIVDDEDVIVETEAESNEYDWAGVYDKFFRDKPLLYEYIEDWLSDRWGTCVRGFSYDIVWDYDNVR